MNGYLCTGLYAPQPEWKGSFSDLDKDKLRLDKLEDYASDEVLMKWAENPPKNMDEGVSACRRWYDFKNYGKPFCCQMYGSDKDYIIGVINSSSVKAQASFGGEVEFGATAFKSA